MEDNRFQAKIIKQGKLMQRLVQAFTIGLLLNSGKAVAQNNQIMLLEKNGRYC